MRFEEPTRWELFLDGFHNFWYALDSYDTIEHFLMVGCKNIFFLMMIHSIPLFHLSVNLG